MLNFCFCKWEKIIYFKQTAEKLKNPKQFENLYLNLMLKGLDIVDYLVKDQCLAYNLNLKA